MKALEVKSKIKNGGIKIPRKIQDQMSTNSEENVKVIVLIDEKDSEEEGLFKNTATKEFLNGYADSDAVYDN